MIDYQSRYDRLVSQYFLIRTNIRSKGARTMSISATQITDKRMPASARIMRLRERLLSSSWEIDLERARFYTRVWKKMEGAPPAMRAAQALKETFQNMTIRIEDDELLVGVKTAKNFAGSLGNREVSDEYRNSVGSTTPRKENG
jgi:hypothetical protein